MIHINWHSEKSAVEHKNQGLEFEKDHYYHAYANGQVDQSTLVTS